MCPLKKKKSNILRCVPLKRKIAADKSIDNEIEEINLSNHILEFRVWDGLKVEWLKEIIYNIQVHLPQEMTCKCFLVKASILLVKQQKKKK